MRKRLGWMYFAAVMLGYALIVLLARTPPAFVDYPDWVYQGALFHGVLTGHPVAGYALKHYPVPNATTTVGIGLLNLVLRWDWAGKIWVCVYLGLALFASWTLAKALRVSDWRLAVSLPALVFLNLNFWYGEISFEMGLCLVMILWSMLIRRTSPVWIATMLVAVFFTHMEACAAALLLVLLWYGLAREWKRLWSLAPSVALTGWYGVARFAGGNVDGEGLVADYRYGSRAFLVYKANIYCKTFGYVNARTPGGLSQTEAIFGRGMFVVLVAASLVIAGLCLWRLCVDVRKTGGVMRLFVFVVLAISLVLPQAIFGVYDPGSRLLVLAAACGFFLVEWRRASGGAITVLSVVFCVANLWQFGQIERNPAMPGHAKDVPAALLTYGHVVPTTRTIYYDRLAAGRMDMPVFPTALFSTERDKVSAGR